MILLNSLPPAYNQLRDTIRYSRDSLSIEELESAIRSKELEIRAEKKTGVSSSNSEALNVRGRTEKRNNNQKNRGKSRSKSKKPDKSKMRCHYCKNLGHFRRECSKWTKKLAEKKSGGGDASVASEGYEFAKVLVHSSARINAD